MSAPLSLPDNGEAMATWQELLNRVGQVEPVAASPFFGGKLVAWVGRTVRLGYMAGSFEHEMASQPDKLSAFQAECSRQVGVPLTVEVEPLSAAEQQASATERPMSALDERARQRVERRRRLRREARNHAVTQAFIEEFGAKIDSISTEADKP